MLKSDLEMDKFREWISKADEEKLIELMSDGKHESGKIMSKPHDKDEKDKIYKALKEVEEKIASLKKAIE